MILFYPIMARVFIVDSSECGPHLSTYDVTSLDQFFDPSLKAQLIAKYAPKYGDLFIVNDMEDEWLVYDGDDFFDLSADLDYTGGIVPEEMKVLSDPHQLPADHWYHPVKGNTTNEYAQEYALRNCWLDLESWGHQAGGKPVTHRDAILRTMKVAISSGGEEQVFARLNQWTLTYDGGMSSFVEMIEEGSPINLCFDADYVRGRNYHRMVHIAMSSTPR